MTGMSGQALADLRARNRSALGLSGFGPGPGPRPDQGFRQWSTEGLGRMGACCEGCANGGTCAAKSPSLGDIATLVPGIPPIGISTSFPPISVQWAPGQTAPVQQTGPGWGDWLMRHVVRPVIDVGGVRVAPYSSDPDYSWAANLLALGTIALGAAGASYVIGRALAGGRR